MVYTFLSIALVSLISFVGVITLIIRKNRLKSILLLLVAFSAGALLGGAMLHLLPEVIEEYGFTIQIPIYILTGMIIFFILEKIVHWHHCHNVSCGNHNHSLGTMNLIGDALHNFIDGMVIAGSYMISVPLGVTTTLAVTLHEIPQEIGDFGVLLHSGLKPKKALLYNFASALFAFLGAIIAIIIGSQLTNFTEVIIPITAGGFIYIASADLIPELHKESKISSSILQLIMILLGIGLMSLLTLIELK